MDETPRPLSLVLIIVLSLVIVGGVTDLWLDGEHWLSTHAIVELSMILVSTGGLIYFWHSWRDSSQEVSAIRGALAQSQRTLSERQAERDVWRASAEQVVAGFGRAIGAQFTTWGLTPAEREVAVLLLQGLGHKQIAARTDRSERTVRQHAVVVYSKAGVNGRAELAAFFLQELNVNV